MLKTLSGNVQRQGPVDTSQFETFWLNEHSKRATITVVQNGVRQPLPSDLVKRHEHIGDETCIIWFDDNGLCHREGNEPAVERFAEDPTDEPVLIQEWWVHGKRHRLYGPAVEYVNGGKEWWVDGEKHRLDGPAAEYANGYKAWWRNGERHRLDGPAIEWPDGIREWFVDDVETEFPNLCEKAISPDLTDEEFYELCSHEDYVVRQIAAHNPKCPEEWRILVEIIDG